MADIEDKAGAYALFNDDVVLKDGQVGYESTILNRPRTNIYHHKHWIRQPVDIKNLYRDIINTGIEIYRIIHPTIPPTMNEEIRTKETICRHEELSSSQVREILSRANLAPYDICEGDSSRTRFQILANRISMFTDPISLASIPVHLLPIQKHYYDVMYHAEKRYSIEHGDQFKIIMDFTRKFYWDGFHIATEVYQEQYDFKIANIRNDQFVNDHPIVEIYPTFTILNEHGEPKFEDFK
jgi:hypothetical protein